MSTTREKIQLTFYVWLLGMTAGVILIEGIVVAPVIFNASDYLETVELSRFQSGLLMTEIFVRTNILLNITATLVLLYEGWYFLKKGTDRICLFSGLVIVIGSYLFTLYFTPLVLEAQEMGEKMAGNPEFNTIHKASELDFKILLVALIVLFCVRVYKGIQK